MKRAFLVAWVAVLVSTVPSIAEAATFTTDDEHLYIRHSEDRVTIIHEGRRHRWGYRREWVSHQIRDRVYITRGYVPLSEDRFVDLVDRSHADPVFTDHVRSEHAARRNWGWGTVGSLLVLGAGTVLSSTDGLTLGPNTTLVPAPGVGMGIAIAGLAGSMVCAWNWTSHVSRPLFSLEDATDAIDAYNRQLDRRLSGEDSGAKANGRP